MLNRSLILLKSGLPTTTRSLHIPSCWTYVQHGDVAPRGAVDRLGDGGAGKLLADGGWRHVVRFSAEKTGGPSPTGGTGPNDQWGR